MKRNAIGAAAVMAAAVSLTLTACGSSGGSSTSTTGASSAPSGGGTASSIPAATISVIAADYGNGPSSANSGQKWWDAVITAFNKQYPQIKVKVNVVNWTDVDNQITKQVQAGDPPDIAQASADWSGLQSQVYPADQVLSPATQANLVQSFAKQGDIGSTQYGIPWIASSRALVYNKTLFSKAGISAAPTTWAEYQADAQKLKSAGVAIPACIPLGKEEAQAEALIWELGNGGGFVDSSGKWTMNSQANVDTFNFLHSLLTAGLTEPNPATTDRTAGCWADFQAGKVGMTNSQPAELPALAKSGVQYAFAPIPGKDGLAPTTLGVNDWIWAFKTKSDHQQQDRALLDFVMSDQNQESFFNEYKLLPITKGASDKVESSNPELTPFLKSLPTDTFYPVNQKTWPAVNTQVKQIIGQAMQSGNPKSILDQLQNTATG